MDILTELEKWLEQQEKEARKYSLISNSLMGSDYWEGKAVMCSDTLKEIWRLKDKEETVWK